VTGLDLVRLQIEIAEGRPLPFTQADLKTNGHAVEARLYAEDPANDFLPSTGRIYDLQLPDLIEGLRIDAGIEAEREVGIHYDPMLAKLIAYAETREAAIRKMIYALRRSSIQGLQTNRDFLIRVLDHQDFKQGRAHTGFIAERLDELIAADPSLKRDSLVVAALYLQYQWRSSDGLLVELPPSYRNNPYRDPSIKLEIGGDRAEVSWRRTGEGSYEAQVFDSTVAAQVLCWTSDLIRIAIDGVQRSFKITEIGDELYIHSTLGSSVVRKTPRHPIHQAASEQGSANSPMPAQGLKILVEVGQ